MQQPIISVSGLRGVVGTSLTPASAMRFACAFAADLPSGAIVLARDGRTTGAMLADAVAAGLCGLGRDVLSAGIAATPTVGVLVGEHQAAGAVQISASHNPPPYNGIKLFSAAGRVLSAAEGEKVVARYMGDDMEAALPWADHAGVGSVNTLEDTTTSHLDLVAATVDVESIRRRAYRVLLDSNHGAGSVLGRRLLEHLGCRVTILGENPNGRFAHAPEPAQENLRDVCRNVQEIGAQIGFCQDPDADRLAVIDETGRPLGEEYTLALCVAHVLGRTPGAVVTNCSTSRMSEDVASQAGVPLYRSAVGEANVAAMMIEHDAVFGGEGNGGPIDPRVGLVRDSFVGMALLLDAMTVTGESIRTLADRLPRYAVEKTKITMAPEDVPAALDVLQRHFAGARADRLDGLRLDWPDRWLLVRASNTEPIVRIVAEAKDPAAARTMCEEAAAAMERR